MLVRRIRNDGWLEIPLLATESSAETNNQKQGFALLATVQGLSLQLEHKAMVTPATTQVKFFDDSSINVLTA